MEMIQRNIEEKLNAAIERGKSILLLGPRQTGKTTVLHQIPSELKISFIQPSVRLRYEKDLSQLTYEIEVLKQDKILP